MQPRELRRLIRDAGRTPAQRKTNYDLIEVFEREGAADDTTTPLDLVDDAESRFGSYSKLAGSSEFRYAGR
jgi:FO synthase subunit 2